jgi:hypothetical protein
LSNIIDLNARRAEATEAAHSSDVADALRQLSNTADAVRDMLRACSEEVTAGALRDAKMRLAFAAALMLGPGWRLSCGDDD